MAAEELADIFSRHLPSDWSLGEELVLFARQPADKQHVIRTRLAALDSFLSIPSPTLAEADRVAAEIGVQQRQLYHILTKLRRFGPTRALSPGFRNVSRSSPVNDGLPEPLEAVLRLTIQNNPGARVVEIYRAVQDEGARLGLVCPSESTVRRRAHALRRRSTDVRREVPFGGSIVVDVVRLKVPVEGRVGRAYPEITLVFDPATRLIFGAGMGRGIGVDTGLRAALYDCSRRIRLLRWYGGGVESKLRQVAWYVTPQLSPYAATADPQEVSVTRRPYWLVFDKGHRGCGDETYRTFGNFLGSIPLVRFSDLAPMEAGKEHLSVSFDIARSTLWSEIDRWNEGIVVAFEEKQLRTAEANEKSLKRLSADLSRIFRPLLLAIDAEHPREGPEHIGTRWPNSTVINDE